jgi:DNA-binding response OmpR family regulator
VKKTGIMVVEDEFVTAEDIKSCLLKSGYEVPLSVGSGEEAVAAAETAPPDLILMDICLSGKIDGIAAAGRIQKVRDIPIVYLTAYSDEEILKRARLTEPFGYIVKPFERRDLESTIEMALYKHEKTRENRQQLKTLEEQNRILQDKVKRLSSDEDRVIQLGCGFSYERSSTNLLYFDKEVALTKKEHLFISLLVKNLGNTVPYGRIEFCVWDDITGVDENTFRIFLWRLRSKIGKELVKNSLGIGYRIENPPG